jgi:predicted small secreted protein
MTRLAVTLLALLTLSAAGCTGNSSKGVNKDYDRPTSVSTRG